LEAGVELYEMRKRSAGQSVERQLQKNLMGSSSSSLHAKTLAIDSKSLFVGSFNFDPRSVHLNTELGCVIESPELAQRVEAQFAMHARETPYKVGRDREGDLQWLEQNGGGITRHSQDPGVG